MSRNFSPYSLSVKSRLTLLFKIYKGFNRSARLAWKFKLGKNITHHYLSNGFTMLFLLTVIAILVNELPWKMIRYQVIIFTQWIKQVKASFPRRSACCCWAAENFPCGFDLHYKYLDSGHTRPPVLKKRSWFISLFSAQVKNSTKTSKYLETPSTVFQCIYRPLYYDGHDNLHQLTARWLQHYGSSRTFPILC